MVDFGELMKKRFFGLLWLLAMAITASSSFADTFHFEDGETVEAKIVADYGKRIKIQFADKDGFVIRDWSEIVSIDGSPKKESDRKPQWLADIVKRLREEQEDLIVKDAHMSEWLIRVKERLREAEGVSEGRAARLAKGIAKPIKKHKGSRHIPPSGKERRVPVEGMGAVKRAKKVVCKLNQKTLAKTVGLCQVAHPECAKPTVKDLLKLGLLVDEPTCPFEDKNTYITHYDEKGFVGVECTSKADHGKGGRCYGYGLKKK